MSHYTIDIPVESEDVKVIKKELRAYLTACGDITIFIKSEIDASPALQSAIRNLFADLLQTIETSEFEGLH